MGLARGEIESVREGRILRVQLARTSEVVRRGSVDGLCGTETPMKQSGDRGELLLRQGRQLEDAGCVRVDRRRGAVRVFGNFKPSRHRHGESLVRHGRQRRLE